MSNYFFAFKGQIYNPNTITHVGYAPKYVIETEREAELLSSKKDTYCKGSTYPEELTIFFIGNGLTRITNTNFEEFDEAMKKGGF